MFEIMLDDEVVAAANTERLARMIVANLTRQAESEGTNDNYWFAPESEV